MSELDALFLDLPEPIQRGIRDLKWTSPMAVQAKVIPRMREGADLIVQAHTGSGKTGAFGIPIVADLDPELNACQALVMAPTRELANQVAGEIETLGRHQGVRCLPIYGGVGYAPQIEGIEAGAHVIVGTPGRMLDHLGSGRLRFDSVKTLILDEADELLSLGFWPDMREINKYLPKERQSCLFSATIPERVRSLSRVFLNEPDYLSLSDEGLAPQEIQHFFMVTTAQEKETNLARVLEYEDPESAIIFCNTKDDVRFVTAYLQRRGFDADQISGDLSQAAREQAMGRIKSGQLRFLVATDVAARGIDISDLSHVIGYSSPQSPEVYIHRTGRTGRAGKAGVAISLVSGLDIGNFRQLQQVNKIVITERDLPSEKVIVDRLQERMSVKVEQEMREIPERERQWKVDRFIPIVESLVSTPEGRRELAAICSSFLREHRPETSVTPPDFDPDAPENRAPPRGRSDRPGGGGRRGGGGGGSRRGRDGGGGGGRRRNR
ncbi:MAG: DEAD/DEAH box helicase [Myxococcales bacterium]|nr:DEAD/DEAH box helicase [Myxococcales bacterium]